MKILFFIKILFFNFFIYKLFLKNTLILFIHLDLFALLYIFIMLIYLCFICIRCLTRTHTCHSWILLYLFTIFTTCCICRWYIILFNLYIWIFLYPWSHFIDPIYPFFCYKSRFSFKSFLERCHFLFFLNQNFYI